MQYDTDYDTDTDAAPWTATASYNPAPAAAPRSATIVSQPVPRTITVNTPQPDYSQLLAVGSMMQSIQQNQTQQMYLLREMDSRLNRLEDQSRYAPQPVAAPTPSYERATWWAIWGLLMLILGGALAVVILLILLNIQFR
jgi:hypothetical protein